MTGATLLVELLTEELPPKALPKLGQAFADGIAAGLRTRGLAAADGAFRWFATPRRLAVSLAGVLPEAAAREVTEKIMPVSVALDAAGQPTAALTKKLEAKGIPLSAVAGFERRMDGKAEALFHTSTVAGARLAEVLAGIVQDALKALPIPKVMRWGDGDATFVRPAHKLTMLHGASVVPGSVLDIQSGRTTRGHRFMSRGDIDIASAGIGGTQHLAAEMLKSQAKVFITHIPYRGSGPAQADFLGGQVPLMVDSVTAALPHIQGGKVVPLAVTSATRSSQLPNVPTVAESGPKELRGFEAVGWLGLMAPKGTPPEVVQRLNAEVVELLKGEALARFIRDRGSEPSPSTTAEFDRFVASEIVKWGAVVRASGASAD